MPSSLHLHPDSLSPDPLYGRAGAAGRDGWTRHDIHPHALLRVHPEQPAARRWADRLDLFHAAGDVALRPDADGRIDLLLDFGTELEAEFDLRIDAGDSGNTNPAGCHLFVSFGESLPEAETWGLPTTNPTQTLAWHITRGGVSSRRFPARGFRFVRLQFHDVGRRVTLARVVARAAFAFRARPGDMQCSDHLFQRVWQASAYTARLCSRPQTYWDGIKRDRHGWFGDARVIQEATDAVFHDPAPAAHMLQHLPIDRWTMGVPGFSFDALAMLRQLILAHGLDQPALTPLIRNAYALAKQFLAWVHATQLTRDGVIRQDPKQNFFGDISFVDWSPLPMGGTFEEMACLQLKHLEALHHAAEIAGWLGHRADAEGWTKRARHLSASLRKRFWRDGRGMLHTLNQTTRKWEPLVVLPLGGDNEFRRKWFRPPPKGPSGPSRHATALACWAGLVDCAPMRRDALRVFASKSIPSIITAYFLYFEQEARARCGEPGSAILAMREFVGDQLGRHDSATVWEWFESGVTDFRQWRMDDWPKSLCHGWGSGIIPLATRHLLGVSPIAPGYGRVRISPAADLPWTFAATVPTPHGPIRVEKARPGGRVEYDIPRGVTALNTEDGDALRVAATTPRR
ncbi:MAG: hypothetical protein NTW19_11595 [Planctomycetota bacterium]|nr:hypothetical protein [Planctomycetota bacterium]